MRSAFRDLAAYSRSFELSNELYEAVARWPPFDRFSTGDQLMRAIDSVGANIAEASGRWQPKDRKRFLVIARASLLETEHWLATAEARNLIETGATQRLDEIARTLGGLISRQRQS